MENLKRKKRTDGKLEQRKKDQKRNLRKKNGKKTYIK